MANLFDKAPVIKPKETTAKKPKTLEINIAGMDKVAAIDYLIKELTTLKKTEETEVKGLVKDEFIETGCKLKRQPPNFRGVDGAGSASCELRKRTSTSALSEEEQMLFLEHEIPMKTIDIVEECYRVNPEYSDNSELLGKVSKAIEKIKDIPEDFIQLQQGTNRIVVGDEALETLYTKPERTVRQLLEMVGVIVLKPKFEGGTNDAFKIAEPLLLRQAAIVRGEAVEQQANIAASQPTAPKPRKKAA